MDTDDWAERMRALAPLAFAREVDPDLLERFIAKKSGDVQDLEGYAAQIEAVLSHDTYARLPEIGAPTLILTGDDDRVIPAPSSDVLQVRIPRSTLRVIEGAGLERPEETLATVQAFLDGPA
jgi:pimeloyl-ACP methyl ester carboxylesterase